MQPNKYSAFLTSVEKIKRNAICGGRCRFCGTPPQMSQCVRNTAIWCESWCQSCFEIMLLSLLYSDSLLWTMFLASKGRKCFRINPKDCYAGDLCSSWGRYNCHKPRTDNMLYAQRVLAGGHRRHNIVCAQEGGFLCVTAIVTHAECSWVPVFFKEPVLMRETRLVSLRVQCSQIVVLHRMEIQSGHYMFRLPQNCHHRRVFWLHGAVIILLKRQIWSLKKKLEFWTNGIDVPTFLWNTKYILLFFPLEFKIQFI